jgi:hypothetical protein
MDAFVTEEWDAIRVRELMAGGSGRDSTLVIFYEICHPTRASQL